jgi:hypothetical protein
MITLITKKMKWGLLSSAGWCSYGEGCIVNTWSLISLPTEFPSESLNTTLTLQFFLADVREGTIQSKVPGLPPVMVVIGSHVIPLFLV